MFVGEITWIRTDLRKNRKEGAGRGEDFAEKGGERRRLQGPGRGGAMPASRLPRCPRARESNVPETRGRVTPFPLATPANRLRRRRGASGDGSGQSQRSGATRTLRGASDSAATGGGPRSGPFHRVPTTLPAPHPPTPESPLLRELLVLPQGPPGPHQAPVHIRSGLVLPRTAGPVTINR